MRIEAYLFFPGNTEEAIGFYKDVFGGEVDITRRGDADPSTPEEEKNLVINAELKNEYFTIRGSDRSDATNEAQTRIELTLISKDEEKLRHIFDRLSEGGRIRAKMEKMFWGDIFGVVIDKYGIAWQVNVEVQK